jgi:hypothetical protein
LANQEVTEIHRQIARPSGIVEINPHNEQRLACGCLWQSSESALAAEEVLDCGGEITSVKFRPHTGSEE